MFSCFLNQNNNNNNNALAGIVSTLVHILLAVLALEGGRTRAASLTLESRRVCLINTKIHKYWRFFTVCVVKIGHFDKNEDSMKTTIVLPYFKHYPEIKGKWRRIYLDDDTLSAVLAGGRVARVDHAQRGSRLRFEASVKILFSFFWYHPSAKSTRHGKKGNYQRIETHPKDLRILEELISVEISRTGWVSPAIYKHRNGDFSIEYRLPVELSKIVHILPKPCVIR